MKASKFFVILISLCFIVSVVSAQDDCPSIVLQAVEAAHDSCDGIGRNQACYGNINLDATARDGVADFTFDSPGDLVDLANLQALQLSSMDTSAGSWGVALMKVQANIPDTLPGQNVTFVMFGDVQIDNKGGALAPQPLVLNVTTTNKVNVRNGPGTSNSRVASLSRGQIVVADGRDESGDWLRVQLEDGQTGWVSAGFVTADGDISTLSVVDAGTGQAVQYGAMQAFYFRSGIGDAPCEQAPDSGLLVQSPQGVERVTLEVNEVTIQLGSTVYLEACSCHGMDVTVVEGGAVVTAVGVSRYVPEGATVYIPTDNNNIASGPPGDLSAYVAEHVQALPIGLLKDAIKIAAPLTDTELVAAQNPTPISGQYTALMIISGGANCVWADGSKATVQNNDLRFTMSDNRDTLTTDANPENLKPVTTVWKQNESGAYTNTDQAAAWTITILSPTIFTLEEHTTAGCVAAGMYTLVKAANNT